MKSFGYPIHYDDFWELCDPNPDSPFHRPFDLGHGETCLANSRMALRTTQAVHAEDCVPFDQSHTARERILRLDWSFFDFPERRDLKVGALRDWEHSWRPLTERGGLIARPPVPAWEPTTDSAKRGGFDFVDKPRLTVGADLAVIPVSILQLIRRLPNPEIFTARYQAPTLSNLEYRWLFFRFTGGRGMAPSVPMKAGRPWDGIPPAYSIYVPTHDTQLEILNP
jgi:hypothetical protein